MCMEHFLSGNSVWSFSWNVWAALPLVDHHAFILFVFLKYNLLLLYNFCKILLTYVWIHVKYIHGGKLVHIWGFFEILNIIRLNFHVIIPNFAVLVGLLWFIFHWFFMFPLWVLIFFPTRPDYGRNFWSSELEVLGPRDLFRLNLCDGV